MIMKKLWGCLVLGLACITCAHPSRSRQALILKDSAAEKREKVTLDPEFLRRQKKAEQHFFSSLEEGEENHTVPTQRRPIQEVPDSMGSFGKFATCWPTKGQLTSYFGMRTLGSKRRMHEGIDISAPIGTPIVAVANGQVLFVGRKAGYGLSVIVAHDEIHETLYAHMHKVHVVAGQYVKRHRILGYVGRTGHATGPNLHFETRLSGVARDPLAFLPPLSTLRASTVKSSL